METGLSTRGAEKPAGLVISAVEVNPCIRASPRIPIVHAGPVLGLHPTPGPNHLWANPLPERTPVPPKGPSDAFSPLPTQHCLFEVCASDVIPHLKQTRCPDTLGHNGSKQCGQALRYGGAGSHNLDLGDAVRSAASATCQRLNN